MPTSAAGTVFLSYRRDDTRHAAGRLSELVADRFGADAVFTDVDSIEPGADFAATIEDAVERSDALVALIGPTWLTGRDARGRRLDDPHDWVVREIGLALARGVRVIPVLVDGAPAPAEADLPPQLARLAGLQAVRLGHGTFRADAGPLVELLARVVDGAARNRAGDIAGEYSIGSASYGAGPHGRWGRVTITDAGRAFRLTWDLSDRTHRGVGLLDGSVLGVAWEEAGAIPGVSLYRVVGGRLTGRWARLDGERLRSGQEVLHGPEGVRGTYRTTGAGAGTATVSTGRGGLRRIEWTTATTSYRGLGLVEDELFVAGWSGEREPGVAGYRVRGARLVGRWARGSATGTETLTRR